MSLLSDIAGTIGHTMDSLSASVGADVGLLETIVNDLDGNNINVFSAASRLGFSIEGFLSGIVNLMRSDPQQLLLERLTEPVKKLDNSLSQISQHWMQVANLHQDTAKAVDTHMNALFQSSGSYAYTGEAADALAQTHQDYRTHFNELIEHAQTQHTLHATLQGRTSDYLSQMPGKVYSLSTPMAALAMLSFQASAPGEVINPEFIQQMEDAARNAWNNSEDILPGPEDPLWDWFMVVVVVLVLFVGLLLLINWLWDGVSQFFNGQKSTSPIKPKPKVGPSKPAQASMTQHQEEDLKTLTREYPNASFDDIKGLLLAGFTADEIRAMLKANFTHDQIQSIIGRIKIAEKDQHGTDKQGLTSAQIRDLVNRVAAAVNSPSEEKRLEGEVAQPLIDDLVSFQRQVTNPTTGKVIGEIDVETSNFIIEVTTDTEGKLQQVIKEKTDKQINPKGKPVILYAPDYSHSADKPFKAYDITIIRSLKSLFEYMRSHKL